MIQGDHCCLVMTMCADVMEVQYGSVVVNDYPHQLEAESVTRTNCVRHFHIRFVMHVNDSSAYKTVYSSPSRSS